MRSLGDGYSKTVKDFFLRTYPNDENLEAIYDNELMEGDPFLNKISKYLRAGLTAATIRYDNYHAWHINAGNMEELGTASAVFLSRIDAYLRSACIVKFEDGDFIDPYLFAYMRKSILPEIQYLKDVANYARLNGPEHSGLSWMAKCIQIAEEARLVQ